MARTPQPLLNMPDRVRQRARADGTLRVWWEPRAEHRALGFRAVELDAGRPDWCRKEARRLNAALDKALATGTRAPRAASRGSRIEDLIREYKSSPEWAPGLAPKSRDSYGKLLLVIMDKWGQDLVADFDKPTMKAWYQACYKARGVTMAARLIRMMSILFSHAEGLGWRAENTNPCFRMKLQTPAPRERNVSWDEYDALQAAAATLGLQAAGAAIALSMLQGQRETDVITAPRSGFRLVPVADKGETRPTWLWFLRRSKRGNLGAMPLHPEAVPFVRAALLPARPDDTPLLVDEATGRPYDEHLFAKRFSAVRAEAAKVLPACATIQFRDLRRSFGAHARAGDATVDDIEDVLGNSVASNAQLRETYLAAQFTTAARAVAAVQRPARKETKG